MKKTALFVLMLTLTASLAHSQVLIALLFGDKLNSDSFQLGIQLAGNFQNVTGWEGTSSRFSLGFGIYGELKLTEKLSLQPEILFKDPRGADGVPGNEFDNENLDPLLADASVTMKLAYVSIPILLKYHISQQFSITDGLLDVFVLARNPISLMAAQQRLLQLESPTAGFHYWQGRTIHIEAEPPKTIWTDGEYFGPTPVTVQVLPGALAVVVP